MNHTTTRLMMSTRPSARMPSASVLLLALALSAPGMAAASDLSMQWGRVLNAWKNSGERTNELVMRAFSLAGVRYVRGGNSAEEGMDCSALVQHVFKQAWGRDLPRTSEEISLAGEPVYPKELQPGDLLFYDTLNRSFSHVGIYLGDSKFIHAPSPGGTIRIENMDLPYWRTRLDGVRRIHDESLRSIQPVSASR